MTVIDLKHPRNQYFKSNNLLKFILSPKHSFGDILRKFEENWTFLMDSACLLSSTSKIGIFHAAL